MCSKLRFSLKKSIDMETSRTCCDYLAANTNLSKGRIKDAMSKGAVWLVRGRSKRRRIRRATTLLHSGDILEFYYDAELLRIKPPIAECLDDQQRYSVWLKPAGLMAQGNAYGDHCALLRQVENHFHPRRPVFLVHRLDREVAGLMIIAHDSESAARLSALFHDHHISKLYRAQVRGKMQQLQGEIDIPLDGRPALTRYKVIEYDPDTNISTLDIDIVTGRRHQIRRHFDTIGLAVMGDPRYGKGNKNSDGLRLAATKLSFRCPFTGRQMAYTSHDNFKKAL